MKKMRNDEENFKQNKKETKLTFYNDPMLLYENNYR
jgi:hypothetical protein